MTAREVIGGGPGSDALGGAQLLALSIYAALVLGGLAANLWIWRASRRGFIGWRRGAQALRRRPFHWTDLLWIISIVLICSGLAGYVASLMWGGARPSGMQAIVLTSLAVHWPTLIATGLLVFLRDGSWDDAFGLSRRHLGENVRLGLVAYLAMMPIVFGHMVVNWLLLRAMGIEPVLQDVASYLLEQASPAAAAYKGFTAVVLAPVAEELLFRGIAFPVLARKLNSVVAMVVVSALFAAIHGEMSVMLPLFVVSLSLCAGYLATRTVLVPVIMHMLFNVTNLWLMSVLLDRPAP